MSLKSWSVLRYLEDNNSPATLLQDGMIHNPAPSTTTPVIATV